MSIIIRRLQPHESAIYREIRLACLKNAPEHFGSTYEEEVLNPKLKFESFIENNAQDHFICGAFDGEKLIGIAGFDRRNANVRVTAARWSGCMWMRTIAVTLPSY